MNDWKQTLVNWTCQADFVWFLAILAWAGVLAGAWNRKKEERKGWLMWLAGAAMIESGINLALYAQNIFVPYIGFDFSLAEAQAIGLSALWWVPPKRLAVRPWLWRVATVVVALTLVAVRSGGDYNTIFTGRMIMSVGTVIALLVAAGVAHRAANLPLAEVHRLRWGLLLLAMLPLAVTYGPLASAVYESRRWHDFSYFELPGAATHLCVAAFLGLALWRERLRPDMNLSTSAAKRWKAGLRLGFSVLAIWLALSCALAVYNGRQARKAFEDSLLSRAQAYAAQVDQNALREALGSNFKLSEEKIKYLMPSGREWRAFKVDWATSPPFDILRKQLNELRYTDKNLSKDIRGLFLYTICEGKLIIVALAKERSENYPWRMAIRDATPKDRENFLKAISFLEGPFRIQDGRGARFAANACVVDKSNGKPLSWLALDISATRWAIVFNHARFQAMVVAAIGVALWVVVMVEMCQIKTAAALKIETTEKIHRGDAESTEMISPRLCGETKSVEDPET